VVDERWRMSMFAGLCDRCAWRQSVPSSRGQVYVLCRRSVDDPRFRKYPVLPVFACSGFEPVDPEPPRSTTS